MRPLGPYPAAPRSCRYCRATLPSAADPDRWHCEASVCVTRARVEAGAAVARARAVREAAWTESALRRTRPALEQVAHALGRDPERVVHGLVPHVFADTLPVGPARRADFAAHLDRLIARAFAEPPPEPDPPRSFEPGEPGDLSRRDAETDAAPSALDVACIACQGQCCMGGRDCHAFLTDRTLAYARHRRPEAGPEDLRAAYLDRVPERAVASSCIYHAAQGCTLDRELRSDVCNHFICGPLYRLGQKHAQDRESPVVAIGLVADQHEHPEAGARGLRIVSASAAGVCIHDAVKLSALTPSEAPETPAQHPQTP